MRPELIELGPGDLRSSAGVLALSPGEAALLAPDHPFLRYGEWRVFASMQGNELLARFVASVDPRQSADGRAVGCIGLVRLDSPGAPAKSRTGARLALRAAVDWLGNRRIDRVRCPVQFSTWYGHRAVTSGFPESGGPPAFAMEPRSGSSLIDLLAATGFVPVHRAVSYAVDPEAVLAGSGPALDRLRRAGLADRPLALSRLEDELILLHRLSMESFRGSWGFSEISTDEFAALYRPISRLADPELVRILETAGGEPAGFAFALPDSPSTPGAGRFVVKSLGLLHEILRRHPGAGAGLTARVHRVALDRGCARGIHALMAEGSAAERLSKHWGTRVRSYATFGRDLG
jgi:hypothetical protein